MGGALDKLLWGGKPDEPDPISGLSRRDIYYIQSSWKPVYSDAAHYGSELFKRLFRDEPEAKTFFKFIKDLDDEQLSTSNQFRAHVINFISAWNMMIQNLNHPELVIAMMHKLGDSHKRQRIPKTHFDVLKDVLVNFLIKDLKLSDHYLVSWEKFIEFVYLHLLFRLEGR